VVGVKLVLWLALITLMTGCGGSRKRDPAGSAIGPAASQRRGCDDSVYGQLATGWRKEPSTLSVGPAAFPYIRQNRALPGRLLAPIGHSGRYRAGKDLLVLAKSARVTLAIPSFERRHVALLYGGEQRDRGAYALSDGATSIELDACPDRPTQFNGGFIVAGARCVAIDVSSRGSARATRGWIPFGTRNRPCPRSS
jgi:hypothetical protein